MTIPAMKARHNGMSYTESFYSSSLRRGFDTRSKMFEIYQSGFCRMLWFCVPHNPKSKNEKLKSMKWNQSEWEKYNYQLYCCFLFYLFLFEVTFYADSHKIKYKKYLDNNFWWCYQLSCWVLSSVNTRPVLLLVSCCRTYILPPGDAWLNLFPWSDEDWSCPPPWLVDDCHGPIFPPSQSMMIYSPQSDEDGTFTPFSVSGWQDLR